MTEANQVFLPHPELAGFTNDFIEELESFPRGRYDDRVDSLAYLLRHFMKSRGKKGLPHRPDHIKKKDQEELWLEQQPNSMLKERKEREFRIKQMEREVQREERQRRRTERRKNRQARRQERFTQSMGAKITTGF